MVNVGERFGAIQKFMSTFEAVVGSERKKTCQLMNFRQYVGYYTSMELYTKAQAEAKWQVDKDSATIYKETSPSNEILIAVELPCQMSFYQQVNQRQALVKEDDVDNDHAETSAAKVRQHLKNVSMDDLSGSVGVGSASLMPGGAAQSSGGQWALGQSEGTPNEKGAKRGLNADNQFMDELGLAIEEGEDEPECSASALVEGRRSVTAESKAFLTQKQGRKSSSYHVLLGMVEKLGDDHSEVVALGCKALVGKFQDLVKQITQLKGEVAHWTTDNVRAKFQAAKSLLASANEADEALCQAVMVLKRVRLTEVLPFVPQSVGQACRLKCVPALVVRALSRHRGGRSSLQTHTVLYSRLGRRRRPADSCS